jgi:hypothetical protein
LASRISFAAASAVPPVAIRSSMSSTRAPSLSRKASMWISTSSTPYSRAYFSPIVVPGSFPFLRMGTKPTPSFAASAAPKMKPRLSMPATKSRPVLR